MFLLRIPGLVPFLFSLLGLISNRIVKKNIMYTMDCADIQANSLLTDSELEGDEEKSS